MPTFPFYKQSDSRESGIACLRMVSKYHKKSFSSEFLRRKIKPGKEGVSPLDLCNTAEALGFRTSSTRLAFEQLGKCELPFIIQLQDNRYFVVYGITQRLIILADPAFGLVKRKTNEFLDQIAKQHGNAHLDVILLQPTPLFFETPNEKKKIEFEFFFKYLRPFRKFYLQLYLGLFVGMVIAFITPFLMQSVVDVGINTQNLGFIQLILAAQLMLALSTTLMNLIRSWIFLHIGSRISIAVISDYLIKLMKLPMSFFDGKSIGDIMQRIGDHSRIQNFVSVTTLNAVFSLINFVVFSVVMVYYNSMIFSVFIFGSLFYGFWVVLFMKKRKEFDHRLFEQNSARQTTLVQLISGIRDIKLHNIETQKRWEWERLQLKGFLINVKQLGLTQSQQLGGFFIDQSKNILISFLSAKAVIDGDMTFGMMLSLQFILGQLNSPVSQFIGLLNAYQDAKISFERIGEVHNNKEEQESNDNVQLPTNHSIKIEGLSFSYDGSTDKKVLSNVSINIPAGKTTAIVGTSGSGKTTLIKLLLKFYDSYEGQIKVGDIDLRRINHKYWRGNSGTVLQDGFIFAESIASNIALGAQEIEMDRLQSAAKCACIYDFITKLPGGFDTKIGMNGLGLSQGQRQRVLIARAIYSNPNILFFDEATNSLDSKTEKEIVANLDNFFSGKTVIVIAHRLSTIRRAHQIIVLNGGQAVEVGNHTELVDKRGEYFELVRNQLELDK